MNGVYFIQDYTNRAVKIGISENIEERLSNLQTANPNPLEIIAIWHYATSEQEQELHALLGSHIIKREWFSLYGIIPFIEWASKYVPNFVQIEQQKQPRTTFKLKPEVVISRKTTFRTADIDAAKRVLEAHPNKPLDDRGWHPIIVEVTGVSRGTGSTRIYDAMKYIQSNNPADKD